MRRVRDLRVLAALVTLAAVAFVLWPTLRGSAGHRGRAGVRAGGGSPPDYERAARAAARRFLDRYVLADGRVARRDQGGDTVSEGQAYALLLTAAIGDRRRYDLVLGWTNRALRRPDGLLSFLWRDGALRDPQAASDADLDAARAMLVAGTRFHDDGQTRAGVALGRAVLAHEVAWPAQRPVLVAGPWATLTPPYAFNPSYVSPRAFEALAAASPDLRWSAVSTASRRLIERLTAHPRSLPPGWASVDATGSVHATGPPGDPSRPPQYAFDAVRVPLRMAEDCDPAGRRVAARTLPLLRAQVADRLVARSDLDGTPLAGGEHPGAAVAAAAAARAAGRLGESDRLLSRAAAIDAAHPTYYGSALVALGRVMLTTRLLGTCPSRGHGDRAVDGSSG